MPKTRGEKLALIAMGQNGLKSVKTRNMQANMATIAAESITGSAATGGKNFYQDDEPAAKESEPGNLWFDTSDNNVIYKYTGSAWGLVELDGSQITPSSIVTGHMAAGAIDASIIDTGTLTTWGTASFTHNAGWTDDSVANTKITSGGAASDVNANSTTISGGKITTGSVTADKLLGTNGSNTFELDGTTSPSAGGITGCTIYGSYMAGAYGEFDTAIDSDDTNTRTLYVKGEGAYEGLCIKGGDYFPLRVKNNSDTVLLDVSSGGAVYIRNSALYAYQGIDVTGATSYFRNTLMVTGGSLDCNVNSTFDNNSDSVSTIQAINSGSGYAGYFKNSGDNGDHALYVCQGSSATTNYIAYIGGSLQIYSTFYGSYIHATNDITADYFNAGGGDGGGSEDAYGLSTGTYKAYVGGGVEPFTGVHLCLTKETTEPTIGDIATVYDAYGYSISQSYFYVKPTTTTSDKKIVGIYSSGSKDLMEFAIWSSDFGEPIPSEELPTGEAPRRIKTEYKEYTEDLVAEGYRVVSINSVGEGMMNVCDENGDIDSGDYITSSNVRGKGMKQDDDLLHNYTVAKALENVVWADKVVGEDGCYELDGHKVLMVACTYHCG